jgi:hypothetical protein
MYHYMQRIVQECVQRHVEECTVGLLCNLYVLGLLWLVGMRLTCRRVLSSAPL